MFKILCHCEAVFFRPKQSHDEAEIAHLHRHVICLANQVGVETTWLQEYFGNRIILLIGGFDTWRLQRHYSTNDHES